MLKTARNLQQENSRRPPIRPLWLLQVSWAGGGVDNTKLKIYKELSSPD